MGEEEKGRGPDESRDTEIWAVCPEDVFHQVGTKGFRGQNPTNTFHF